jgi:hypothetical protein
MDAKIVMKRVTELLAIHMTSMFSTASVLQASPTRYSQRKYSRHVGHGVKPVAQVLPDRAVDTRLVPGLPHGGGLRLTS